MSAVLSICTECGSTEIEGLRETLSAAGLPNAIEVRESACLGPCDTPSAVSLQSPGMAGYVFAGINCSQDAEDIVATCTLYLQSDQGWIEDARPCGRLRHLLVARMPA